MYRGFISFSEGDELRVIIINLLENKYGTVRTRRRKINLDSIEQEVLVLLIKHRKNIYGPEDFVFWRIV